MSDKWFYFVPLFSFSISLFIISLCTSPLYAQSAAFEVGDDEVLRRIIAPVLSDYCTRTTVPHPSHLPPLLTLIFSLLPDAPSHLGTSFPLSISSSANTPSNNHLLHSVIPSSLCTFLLHNMARPVYIHVLCIFCLIQHCNCKSVKSLL